MWGQSGPEASISVVIVCVEYECKLGDEGECREEKGESEDLFEKK